MKSDESGLLGREWVQLNSFVVFPGQATRKTYRSFYDIPHILTDPLIAAITAPALLGRLMVRQWCFDICSLHFTSYQRYVMEQILGLCAGRLISSTANSFILAFMYLTLCTVAQEKRTFPKTVHAKLEVENFPKCDSKPKHEHFPSAELRGLDKQGFTVGVVKHFCPCSAPMIKVLQRFILFEYFWDWTHLGRKHLSMSVLTFCSSVVTSCSDFTNLNLRSLICLLASPTEKENQTNKET